MMNAQQCRARAEALEGVAGGCADALLKRLLDATALEWRHLADIADWQDTLFAASMVNGAAS